MNEALEVLLHTRSFLYTYVSRAFAAEPDESFLGIVKGEHAKGAWELLEGERGEGGSLQRALAKAVEEQPDSARLQSEYTRLLVGPRELPAPPWESVYATGEPLLFQESTLAVREAYRNAGFRSAGYPHEPDDHLATELSFMAALAGDTCSAYGGGDSALISGLLDMQSDFLEQHLIMWVGSFANRLAETGISEFYSSFAAMVVLLCERDRELLGELRSSV